MKVEIISVLLPLLNLYLIIISQVSVRSRVFVYYHLNMWVLAFIKRSLKGYLERLLTNSPPPKVFFVLWGFFWWGDVRLGPHRVTEGCLLALRSEITPGKNAGNQLGSAHGWLHARQMPCH